ncbi:unnamed protein product, partial [Didymodactylos carnosus]
KKNQINNDLSLTMEQHQLLWCNYSSSKNADFIDPAPPIPPGYLQITALFIYTLLSILTITSNIFVCLVVFCYQRMVTVTNLFIVNLAISDLLVGIFCIPIVLISDYLLSNWPFGAFMCKFFSFAQSVCVTCTIYTLIAMSIDRYLAVVHPMNPLKITQGQCKKMLAFIWLFAISFSIPVYIEMNTRVVCFKREDGTHFQMTCEASDLSKSIQTAYNIASIVMIYFIPLVVLSIVYIHLGQTLNKSRAPGEAHSERDAKMEKSKRKVIKMCCIVVIMFGICWLPMQIYINILRQFLEVIGYKYIPHLYFAFHIMAMSNSCINPFIYGVMSSKFRNGYLYFLKCQQRSMRKNTLSSARTSKDLRSFRLISNRTSAFG